MRLNRATLAPLLALAILGSPPPATAQEAQDTILVTINPAPVPPPAGIVWTGPVEGTVGDTLFYLFRTVDADGDPTPGTVAWSLSDGTLADLRILTDSTLALELLEPGTVYLLARTDSIPAGTTPDPEPEPTPDPEWHEPPGFTVQVDANWNSWPPGPGRWWWDSNLDGDVELLDGRLVWTYPAGMGGGHVPGSKVTEESLSMGPYIYHRDEGVELSGNFHGHWSGVNKFRYWPNDRAAAAGILGFFGANDGPLTLGLNSAWAGEWYDRRLRWNTPGNLATPTQAAADFTRGVPHDVETLTYLGTPGQADGWVRVWLDGVEVLHFRGLGFVAAGHAALSRGIHLSPVWGGTNDVVPATQTLAVDRTYVSSGTIIP